MLVDRGPLSSAYRAYSPAGDVASVASRVDVHRRGVAVGSARVRFGSKGTTHAFDSLELPVSTVDATGGEVLVSIESEEVNGALVVARNGRVEAGFPFFD